MEVVVLGIGNYSEVIIELCLDIGHDIEALYHFDSSRNNEKIMGYKIQGSYKDFLIEPKKSAVVVAIGDNILRAKWLNQLRNKGYFTPSLIHPLAYISPSSQIGSAVYIHANSFIWTKVKIFNNVIISPHAVVAHHTTIGEASHISANSTIGAYVTIEENVLVGINAGIISKPINIGANSILGANSMIVGNVPKNAIMIGTPGKKHKNWILKILNKIIKKKR